MKTTFKHEKNWGFRAGAFALSLVFMIFSAGPLPGAYATVGVDPALDPTNPLMSSTDTTQTITSDSNTTPSGSIDGGSALSAASGDTSSPSVSDQADVVFSGIQTPTADDRHWHHHGDGVYALTGGDWNAFETSYINFAEAGVHEVTLDVANFVNQDKGWTTPDNYEFSLGVYLVGEDGDKVKAGDLHIAAEDNTSHTGTLQFDVAEAGMKRMDVVWENSSGTWNHAEHTDVNLEMRSVTIQKSTVDTPAPADDLPDFIDVDAEPQSSRWMTGNVDGEDVIQSFTGGENHAFNMGTHAFDTGGEHGVSFFVSNFINDNWSTPEDYDFHFDILATDLATGIREKVGEAVAAADSDGPIEALANITVPENAELAMEMVWTNAQGTWNADQHTDVNLRIWGGIHFEDAFPPEDLIQDDNADNVDPQPDDVGAAIGNDPLPADDPALNIGGDPVPVDDPAIILPEARPDWWDAYRTKNQDLIMQLDTILMEIEQLTPVMDAAQDFRNAQARMWRLMQRTRCNFNDPAMCYTRDDWRAQNVTPPLLRMRTAYRAMMAQKALFEAQLTAARAREDEFNDREATMHYAGADHLMGEIDAAEVNLDNEEAAFNAKKTRFDNNYSDLKTRGSDFIMWVNMVIAMNWDWSGLTPRQRLRRQAVLDQFVIVQDKFAALL